MKIPADITTYYFVDESGDPVFYDKYRRLIVGKEGCSRIFMVGYISTNDPVALRNALSQLRASIITDTYYQGIPSLEKTKRAFHAKDDIPEIREKVYRLIATLDFKAQFIVGRKIEKIFVTKHKSSTRMFYDDLVSKLFQNKLHTSLHNVIYISKRDNHTRQEPLQKAIDTAKAGFEKKWKTQVEVDTKILVQQPTDEPCLQIVDYMNWAIYRAFVRGEDRYYRLVADKVSYLVDLYDSAKYPHTFYSKSNPFEIQKMSPM